MKNILIALVLFSSVVLSFAQSHQKTAIYFRFNDYKLDNKAISKLDSLLRTSHYRSFKIEAHCDSVGSHAYNDKLSLQRAQSVRNFLIERNINDTLISIKALGKRFPLVKNETDESRAMNRCVELYILPFEKPPVNKKELLISDTLLIMDKIDVGTNLRLDNINFEGGKHKLIPSSVPTLQQLLKTMKMYPTLVVEIQGHICCESPGHDGLDFDTQTNDLSVNRAKVVYDYLVERGISASRLSYKGLGSNNKLVEEKTEADKTTNRRVEIKIVRK
jgi:outer membrane protein OmpA-like peptidoglycan-associated protein